MIPVNTKSLFHTLCQTLERLDKGEIDINTANTVGKLVGQATNLMNYELKRAIVMSNEDFKKNHRNLESKVFDSLPE
jgi:hypothetical protein